MVYWTSAVTPLYVAQPVREQLTVTKTPGEPLGTLYNRFRALGSETKKEWQLSHYNAWAGMTWDLNYSQIGMSPKKSSPEVSIYKRKQEIFFYMVACLVESVFSCFL